MYDFYLGSREEILEDPLSFLIAVKHSLPRWVNSLPDSEYIALAGIIQDYVPEESPIIVETGVGSSTLLFVFFAMLRGGRVFSWDMNSEKASHIRSVCADAFEQILNRPVSAHWTFISSMSLAPHTGLSMLRELTTRVDLTHHDSDHTWQTVSGEVTATIPMLSEGSVVCVDDANQTYKHTYEPIINVTRKKAGLSPIEPISENRVEPHIVTIPRLLGRSFRRVDDLTKDFKTEIGNDLYYRWYKVDRDRMNEVGMEVFASLPRRFGAWRVAKRNSS